MTTKKIYFASDIHLGMHPRDKSLEREKIFVRWLEEIKKDASEIFLLGDIFDYWWEYKKVVPRGFTRFLGKVSEITDNGIPVHFFTGNHDVWVFDYLSTETGMIIHKKPLIITINGKKIYLAHGHGLGPKDFGYKFLLWCFHNPVLQWLYARVHPNLAVSIGHLWSKNSRYAKGISIDFQGKEKELLVAHSKKMLKKEHFDYFIYGHRHIPIDIQLNEKSRMICLGDWIKSYTYAVLEEGRLSLKTYQN